jgi:hypothetical protein
VFSPGKLGMGQGRGSATEANSSSGVVAGRNRFATKGDQNRPRGFGGWPGCLYHGDARARLDAKFTMRPCAPENRSMNPVGLSEWPEEWPGQRAARPPLPPRECGLLRRKMAFCQSVACLFFDGQPHFRSLLQLSTPLRAAPGPAPAIMARIFDWDLILLAGARRRTPNHPPGLLGRGQLARFQSCSPWTDLTILFFSRACATATHSKTDGLADDSSCLPI